MSPDDHVLVAGYFSAGAPAARRRPAPLSTTPPCAVQFVDAKEGWAVGDEGRHLAHDRRRPNLGTAADRRARRFAALGAFFSTRTRSAGSAAARNCRTAAAASACLLFTSDGGPNGRRLLANALPGLNQVRFRRSAKTASSSATAASSSRPASSRPPTAAAPGSRSPARARPPGWPAISTTPRPASSPALEPTSPPCARQDRRIAERRRSARRPRHHRLQILGKRSARGRPGRPRPDQRQRRHNVGLRRQQAADRGAREPRFPRVARRQGTKVWIVGRPGSVVPAQRRCRHDLDAAKTGQPLPLHGVYFFDEKPAGPSASRHDPHHRRRRQDLERAAPGRPARRRARASHASNKTRRSIPCACLGGAEGYLTTSLRITAPDPSTIAWGREPRRRTYAAAMRLAGATDRRDALAVPDAAAPRALPDKKTILAHWNQLHAQRAPRGADPPTRADAAHLAAERRDRRASAKARSRCRRCRARRVQEAVRRPPTRRRSPSRSSELGLNAWKVAKVYAAERRAASGSRPRSRRTTIARAAAADDRARVRRRAHPRR